MHDGASAQLLNARKKTVESPFLSKAKRCFAPLAAATAIVAAVIAAEAVKDNYDNDNPENPFATVTIVIISKAHKSSSFRFFVYILSRSPYNINL